MAERRCHDPPGGTTSWWLTCRTTRVGPPRSPPHRVRLSYRSKVVAPMYLVVRDPCGSEQKECRRAAIHHLRREEMPSRISVRLAAAAPPSACWQVQRLPQDKRPAKPVTIIVPFAAGGNTDVMARIFSDHLSKRLGQQFIVENWVGAGGVTGLQALTQGGARRLHRRGGHLGRPRHQSRADQGQYPMTMSRRTSPISMAWRRSRTSGSSTRPCRPTPCRS